MATTTTISQSTPVLPDFARSYARAIPDTAIVGALVLLGLVVRWPELRYLATLPVSGTYRERRHGGSRW